MKQQKILSADEIRIELTKRRLTRKQLSRDLGLNYDYLVQILLNQRKAFKIREKITLYLRKAS